MSLRVAVLGATGVVGSRIIQILRERDFPVRELVPFASERSAGRHVEGADVPVQAPGEDTVRGFDLALFSAGGGTSAEWAPRFVEAGAVVVDNSSYWRMHEDVPLVVSEVNPEALDEHRGIVANPNCTTMGLVVALKPIEDAVGIERLVVSTYQSVSGTGKAALDEMDRQSRALLAGERPPTPEVYPHRIAFNVLPQVETFKDGDDYTTEERKVIAESRKILGRHDLRVTATCARVPVPIGHSESVNVETRADLSPAALRELLAAAPGVQVLDDPAHGLYPLPDDVAGRDDVYVGRIRRDEGNDRTLNFWLVSDNLRKGAALNTVQLAERLHERGLVRVAARA